MSKNKIIQIQNKNDAQILYDLNIEKINRNDAGSRLLNDLNKQIFYGYFAIDSELEQNNELSKDDINSYVLFYHSYSTWQNRTIHIADLWFKPSLSDDEKFSILKELRTQLFIYARKNLLNRVNYHIYDTNENKQLIDCLLNKELGAVNLSLLEDWLIYEMNIQVMKEFISKDYPIPENYKIQKVTEIKEYASDIRDLIVEIAIYEKMLEQCQMTSEYLIRDYKYLNENEHNRFYESMVVLNDQKEVIGYAIYYRSYEVERGVGCYLEDLYIQEKYRRKGLGGALWKELIKDCLDKFNVNFMQWSVLAWNKLAIDFYHKCGARHLKDLCLFRFKTEVIYQ
ncbi:unnamed protein product [Brachionus calyciflorus]|uniref:N-acetyltransferase domain-containing protein n=1 Tax=Brachionus calyciflorus TaxID=104777 RepID=A0A813MHT0_9BILA|nr:unnamed protein product [Brachionus calyciflorus]